MRFVSVALLTMLGATAFADQLIDIPTARLIVFEDFRYELRSAPYAGGDQQQYLALGVGKSWELDLRDIQNSETASRGTFDLQYCLLQALPDISPAVSFGVQDGANETMDGRRFYAVTTFRESLDDVGSNAYADITLGYQSGSLDGMFAGVKVPLTTNFAVLGEDSGFRLSAGFEYRPTRNVTLRWITRDQQTLLSLSAVGRF